MFQTRSILSLFALILIGITMMWTNTTKAADGLKITDIRFGQQQNDLRIVLDLNQNSDYRAFVLQDPYRLVIDLPEFTWHKDQITGGKQSLIGEYRFGTLQPGVSRLVFEVNKPIKIKSSFILPHTDSTKDRLVLDIAPTSSNDFNQHKNDVFGNKQFLSSIKQSTTVASYIPPKAEPYAKPAKKPYSGRKKLVVIDAGHGGNDPGAISLSGTREKHITLAIAKEVKRQLEATGRYNVKLTRTGDYYIKLRQRYYIAKDAGADLFISIHADSINRRSVRGISIYTLSETSSDKESERLAARENLSDVIAGVELEKENNEVANILIDLAMRDTMNESKKLANIMVKNMRSRGLRLLSNTHRHAGFAVLKAPDVPSLLIESGYLSNEQDANLLKSTKYQRKLAGSILDGIDEYFRTVSE